MFAIRISAFLLVACGFQLTPEAQLSHVDNPNTEDMDLPPELDSSPFNSFSSAICPPFSSDEIRTFQFTSDSSSPSITASNAAKSFTDLVKVFTLRFIQGIKSDKRLKNAFSLHRFTENEAAELIYDIVYNAHSSVNGNVPAFSAQEVSEAYRTHFRQATTDNIIRLYANSVGKYLLYNGLLTTENVRGLAVRYLGYIKDSVYSVTRLSQEDAFRAVEKGFLDFLTYAGLYRQDNAASFATYFINELLLTLPNVAS